MPEVPKGKFVIVLPPVFDPNGDDFEVKIETDTRFIKYNKINHTLEMRIDKIMESD